MLTWIESGDILLIARRILIPDELVIFELYGGNALLDRDLFLSGSDGIKQKNEQP